MTVQKIRNDSVAVVGAGSWGTAIAGLLSENGFTTHLWGHRKEHIEDLRNSRCNDRYLPHYQFCSKLQPTENLEECVAGKQIICMAVPSQFFRNVFTQVLTKINCDCAIISAVKGIENQSLMTMTQVMEEEINNIAPPHSLSFGVLSGPSFAKEVAEKTPTAVTLGFSDIEKAQKLQNYFVTDYFRVYASRDLLGLEISGAFKNIIAIATGICDGLGYGLNTRAALITRGLAEITRYGVHRGADPHTFSGLSGLGDLILTCTGELSRNRTVGYQLGQGRKLQDILGEMNMIAEGVKTSRSGYSLTAKSGIEMPILEQVYKIIHEGKPCQRAVKDLLARELTVE